MARYINDNGEYYNGRSVVYNDQLIINPDEATILAAGYHKVEDVEPDPLVIAKQARLADIDDEDNSKEVFTIGGQQMWLGHELRQQLKTSVEAYIATGRDTVTKWFNGQEFTFPCNVWLQMLAVLEVYAAEVLNTTEAHKAAVMALDSIENIENYDITAGYPQPLAFTPEMLKAMGE